MAKRQELALVVVDEGPTVTLSSGITFKLGPPRRVFYEELFKSHLKQYPELNEDQTAPAFRKAMDTLVNHLVDAAILMGLLPFDLPEDDEWLEELRIVGMVPNESKPGLRICYVRNVAIRDADDVQLLLSSTLGELWESFMSAGNTAKEE